MAYENLTAEQLVKLADAVPERAEPRELHDYIRNTRNDVNGWDEINIPESHIKLLRGGENHEGSGRLNARIRNLASWFSAATPRFEVRPSGPEDVIRPGVDLQERFARQGEALLGEGPAGHNWKQAANRDLAELGIAVIQQNPRAEFYLDVKETPDQMADGALLTDVIWRRRVDPATWSWIEGEDGSFPVQVISGVRHLGEMAHQFGEEATLGAFDWFDFGEKVDAHDSYSWGPDIQVTTSEIWTPDQGALLITSGPKPKPSFDLAGGGRILKTWNNSLGKPPFYIRNPGTWPWHSPLDEMIQLTGARNYWATMQDLQASGAIFRHWQLIQELSEGDQAISLPDAIPEHLIYDMSKPPPDMGPGTRWELAPFEFHDVSPRYQQIALSHEMAGASVARLVGQSVNQNTAVGTADTMLDSAQDEFADFIESIETTTAEMWSDLFHWIRVEHKDPVLVFDMKRTVTESGLGFASTLAQLSAADIKTDHVGVVLDTRSELAKLRDYRLGRELQDNGDADYRTRVLHGLVPFVFDAEEELQAIYTSQAEQIGMKTRLMAKQLQDQQNLMGGTGGGMPLTEPNITDGSRTDPRGTGTGQGPDNVSNTALSEGGADVARSA